MSASTVRTQPSSVALPKNSPGKAFGLIILSIFLPPLAIYLDGGSLLSVCLNFVVWINLVLPSIIWSIVFVCRSRERRGMSRPARYSLWVKHEEGARPYSHVAPKEQHTEQKNAKGA
ncbi:hypothetical protein P280DRAFT_466150 [Massarina eburnea CBS 473.64]|uniref:Uncharacterized protein n=1 Tax=Massarina eburnea CBS 473.64 TaxID=1395130 RepID=A0A6A6SCK1_9PLEO|nr:hypothetical protein P280DRAFT_466150 [Massarina eburnea CBS 473.64]